MSGNAANGVLSMTEAGRDRDTFTVSPGQSAELTSAGDETLDAATILLVQLGAQLAGGAEADVRQALQAAHGAVPAEWVEELILQTYLFAGFPRSLNGAREWRRISGRAAPLSDDGEQFDGAAWRARGEATCETVYGRFYKQLRENIRHLHPALDAWMIVEGYGKVLSRPALALWRRELCIVAACAIGRQDRQLHSHLHGALHAGASATQVQAALDAVRHLLSSQDVMRYNALWSKVRSK